LSEEYNFLIKSTPTLGKFHKALAKAQGELQNPAKNQTANVRGTSKDGKPVSYQFHYADLASGLEEVRPVLSKHGLFFYQVTVLDGAILKLVTRLGFEDEWIDGELPIGQGMSDIQKMGAMITYLRRYELFPMVGIAADEDVEADQLDESPEDKMKAAKAAAEAEAKQIEKYRELFSSAENVEQLQDLSKRHAELIGKFSSAGKASLRRHVQECERALKGKKDGGNSPQ
jgi:hypothetical protein